MKWFAAIMISVGLTAGTIAVANPAQAAVNCAAAKPAALSGARYALLNTYAGTYTGKPFSFKLTVHRYYILDGHEYKTFTYSPRGRATTTGALSNWHGVTRVETWYAGQKCRTWVGYVKRK